ncbi:hypothetical protein [Tersicoccus sp. Bi-70]|uniref:hypothetical protein n=1 Tax=Tersicoccus sp. Bi-70 TaxID=1897634 RepID=UPI000977E841|nr:hypothetical protein [Tersicoccus sp. Bi-70]OMH37087.1 hypothetical protein BGP79_15490 [Tersicoccus sp. Bi-70]
MSGASSRTRRVQYINANWSGTDEFALLVVTDDGERHVLPASAAAFGALVATMKDGVTFLFDPEEQTLIVANLVGRWITDDETPAAAGTPAT